MERSPEVVAGLAAFYAALNSQDVEQFSARLADGDGVSVIGTAPGEGHDSRDDWIATYRVGIGEFVLRLEGGDSPVGYRSGDVGFAIDRPTFVLPGGRLPARLTAVLAEQDGEWRMVHAHFSVGVPDEEALEPAG